MIIIMFFFIPSSILDGLHYILLKVDDIKDKVFYYLRPYLSIHDKIRDLKKKKKKKKKIEKYIYIYIKINKYLNVTYIHILFI